MAGRDKNINEDDDEGVKPPKGNKDGLVKWALIGCGVLVLIGVSVGTSIYVMKSMMAAPAEKSIAKSTDAKAKDDKNKKKEPKIAIFYKFDPPFVVNIQSQSNNRFLQLTLEAMTYDKEVTTDIDQYMPIIRNNILLLLSSLTYDQVSTLDGKQKLREDILKEIQNVLKDKIGKSGVDNVYLTSIVMQ
jgi:flagellar protein FliL